MHTQLEDVLGYIKIFHFEAFGNYDCGALQKDHS